MKNRFSIGEMSKLHNVSIKTLIYYDEIGLLAPIQVNENNKYRYYSTEQFEQLNTINYLRELGFSLKEIKSHLEQRNINSFLDLLKEQKKLTENKIKELQQINRRFQNRIDDINQARRIKKFGVVIIKDVKERKIVSLKEKIDSEPELEMSLRRLENMSDMSSSIFIGGVGLTIGIDNIKKGKFDEYNSIFILLEEDNIQNDLATTLQEGTYACIYYRGNHNESSEHYRTLLNYIKENDLQIIGDSIERTIVDHYISNNAEDYLTELQIPIK